MPSLISLIPTLLSGIKELVQIVNSVRSAARQSGELTPEQDAAYADELAKLFAQPHWRPRDK